jgi:hypothetical protein
MRIGNWSSVIFAAAAMSTSAHVPAFAQAPAYALLTVSGFHFEAAEDGSGDPTPGEAFALGDRYVLVGKVTAFGTQLESLVDTGANEYTVVVTGGFVTSRQVYSPFASVVLGGDMHARIFEDPKSGGTPAVYTPNPPNADVPSSFSDGTVVLGATLSSFYLLWREDYWNGSLNAQMIVLDEGTLLAAVPEGSRTAYDFSGEFNDDLVPEGFRSAINGGMIVRDTPVQLEYWGNLKKRYR